MKRRVALVLAMFLLGAGLRLAMRTGEEASATGLFAEGVEVQMIVLASPACGICTSSEFTELIGQALAELRSRAWPEGYRFSAVFVGLGVDHEELMDLAESYGEFEELDLGNGWTNLGAMRYIWSELPSLGATPNVAITRRDIQYDAYARGVAPPDEVLLERFIGLDEFDRWIANGMMIRNLGAGARGAHEESSSDAAGS